ncbi:hypothetical protein ARMSODRAFT_1025340 [Armillaria solidipes]|uniref:Uncharacterized protein n=1 Tax=Armillaria solidipes TaxID=1076256 RepID=A0A2H3BD88_9AGAR|nr:hypothetical protein ARMSODRAFT_1025340 [Armillaria solidipes]
MSSSAKLMDELIQKHSSKLSYQFPQSFASFLNTNELPKADVLASLSKNVSDALQSVTSDIECLLNTYFQLQNIHHHLLQLDTDCKKAMAPAVARLPPEMLMEVFRVSHAVCDHGDILDLSWSPYVISHVCRLWRYIAIEKCPEIWADFGLERNRWDFLKDPVALLSLALSRSGNSPLKFLVEGAGGNDCQLVGGLSDETELHWTTHENRDDGVTEEILQVLVEHCRRWKDVYFDIPLRLFHLLCPIRGRLQALVAFSYNETSDIYPSLISIESDILDGAPVLETITVSYFPNIESPMVIFVPRMCPKLNSFTDNRRWGDDGLHQHFLDIVRYFPDLRNFAVHLTGSFSIANPRIVNQSIIQLTASSGSFLRSITLPQLKDMDLMGSGSGSQADIHDTISSLYDLVAHSACSLASLKVSGCAVDKHLIYILQASPEITALSLIFSKWQGDSVQTVQSLITRLGEEEPALVPNLQTLSLKVRPDASSQTLVMGLLESNFLDSIEKRWRKGSLRSVTVNILPQLQASQGEFTLTRPCHERLARMRKEGFGVCFCRHYISLLG